MSLTLEWHLGVSHINKELRYCSHCKKKVEFQNSNIIRRNANGKNIYEFAIYKCENDHTWNKKIGIYKPKLYQDQLSNEEKSATEVNQPTYADVTYPLDIRIISGGAGERLDKLLAERLVNRSRMTWQQHIKDQQILVNLQPVKGSYKPQMGDVISILI